MKKSRRRFGLPLLFSMIVFGILLVTAFLMGALAAVLYHYGVWDAIGQRTPLLPLLVLLVVSVLIGTLVAAMMGRFVLRPVRSVIRATNQLASGDFSARLDLKHPPEMAELSDSFNRMATELGSTELLRSDFVNNFSHEFKTPIVSIRGFAQMLKYGDLTESERNEYLDIVIAESTRLSGLATNVLNLTKVENQTILTEQAWFNVSEQIRDVVVLLQQKWEEKQLDVIIDGDDVLLFGNAELLGQVWRNLFDNAVKFSPVGGQVRLKLRDTAEAFAFAIQNGGEPIPKEAQAHIFDKFYQADTSHVTTGNGLGLTLAARIVSLHDGTVTCACQEGATVFTVTLPHRQ